MNKYTVLIECVVPTPAGDDRKAASEVVELTEEQAAPFVESNSLEFLEEVSEESTDETDEAEETDESKKNEAGSDSGDAAK